MYTNGISQMYTPIWKPSFLAEIKNILNRNFSKIKSGRSDAQIFLSSYTCTFLLAKVKNPFISDPAPPPTFRCEVKSASSQRKECAGWGWGCQLVCRDCGRDTKRTMETCQSSAGRRGNSVRSRLCSWYTDRISCSLYGTPFSLQNGRSIVSRATVVTVPSSS